MRPFSFSYRPNRLYTLLAEGKIRPQIGIERICAAHPAGTQLERDAYQ